MKLAGHLLTPLVLIGVWLGNSSPQAAIAGSVVAWGNNEYGQTTVPLAAKSGVTAIAAGAYHTVALKTDGTVLAWGYQIVPQTHVPVAAQNGVTAIAAGTWHTLALKTDGSVVAWGNNEFGQTNVPSGLIAVTAIRAFQRGARRRRRVFARQTQRK
jgi:alpha-tubulin suppressor-like RCC1 family protein